MQNAYKLHGKLKGIKEGKLEIQTRRSSTNVLVTPGFDLTPKFISDWAEHDVHVVVIDDKAVQVKRSRGPFRSEVRYPRDL